MKKRLLTIAVILISGYGMVAKIHLPELKDNPAGLEIKKIPIFKNESKHLVESTDFQ